MKVSVPKDFGNTAKKPVLPLVPEPIKSVKKEDLATVNLCSNPADHDSTQVKFSFKGLDGDHETPSEILEWRRNVDRALTGLDLNANGLSNCNMCKQFMRGSALSSFIAKAGTVLVDKKAEAIAMGKTAMMQCWNERSRSWCFKVSCVIKARAVVACYLCVFCCVLLPHVWGK